MNYLSWILITIIIYPSYLIASNPNLLEASYIKACYKKTICFNLEHANTIKKRTKGLMYRRSLKDNHGMIFSWEEKQYISMWMKNTYISLDMIWLNEKFKVICTKENAIPFDTTPITCSKKANYVIELNAGTIKKHMIKKNKKFKLNVISEQQ